MVVAALLMTPEAAYERSLDFLRGCLNALLLLFKAGLDMVSRSRGLFE